MLGHAVWNTVGSVRNQRSALFKSHSKQSDLVSGLLVILSQILPGLLVGEAFRAGSPASYILFSPLRLVSTNKPPPPKHQASTVWFRVQLDWWQTSC